MRSGREAGRRRLIPSHLIKVLVPDKGKYAILADVLREARAKNNCDSSMDDADLQNRTSEEMYLAQRMRTIDRDDKNLFCFTKHQRMTESAPQAMQEAIKKSRWKAWLSGQSGAKTTAISSLLFCRPDQCSLTNSYVENNSSLISE
jgi:hypothetical protein